jgi:hypothetical protein
LEVPHDAVMTDVDRSDTGSLRTAAIGGAGFTVAYLVHRLLQGLGPDGTDAASVEAYVLDHRDALLASEVVLGIGLLAFIAFVAALVPAVWRSGQGTLAIATGICGALFLGMGFVSSAAETALYAVAGSDQLAAVAALNELQGRTPVVWTITALVAALSLAVRRTGLVWRWLAPAGFVAAGFFLLGSVFSVLGRSAEGRGSLVGVGLFIVWMAAFCAGLWARRHRPVSVAAGGVLSGRRPSR